MGRVQRKMEEEKEFKWQRFKAKNYVREIVSHPRREESLRNSHIMLKGLRRKLWKAGHFPTARGVLVKVQHSLET